MHKRHVLGPAAISASFTWKGSKIRRRRVGLGFLTHACPNIGVDRVGRSNRFVGSFVTVIGRTRARAERACLLDD